MEDSMKTQAELIARAYDAAPLITPEAGDAYRTLAAYVRDRFVLLHAQGWRTVPTLDDAAPELAEVARTRIVPVYDSAHAHPALSDGENYMFRAVHDVYGHLASDPVAPFGLAGEISTARTQAEDFTAWAFAHNVRGRAYLDAHAALWTEIVGQASYHAARGRFPVQKAALLDPEQFIEIQVIENLQRSDLPGF